MANWCCNYETALAEIETRLKAGIIGLVAVDNDIVGTLNVIPPPASLPRPTSAYTSKESLAWWYVFNCGACGT